MNFEEKLSQMYNEIANEISGMIPVEWEQVFTIAYVTDQAGEVIFNYTKPGSDELNYYTYIPREYNVSEKVFYDLWTDLYRLFKKLRNAFKEDLEPWTSCEFDFTREGNLKVSFDYIDWIKLGFGPNEIANEISGMIPVEWEKVYTIAYVDDEGGEVVFNYTKPGSDELNYYTYIPREYNVSEKVFYDLWTDLYRLFKKLRNAFKEEDLEPWTSCEFDFTSEGKLKVSFDYIDWINTEFDQLGRENYYMYKKFGVIPEMEYEMEEVKEIEQYIKEQDEAEL
ncbi:Uncharacterized conserved protein [Staphylococcus aureus]|nr:Uncharacterized conserved protein [Staphylococcus aureus]